MLIRTRTHYAIAAALVASLALAGCKKKEEPAPPPPAVETPAPAPAPAPEATPAPAALSVSSVSLGTTAGADKKIAMPTTSFKPTDKTIIVSVATDGAATNQDVSAKLLFQDGQTVEEKKQTLNTAGAETTNFEFTKASPWPAGKYKVEISANGAVANTTEFDVK